MAKKNEEQHLDESIEKDDSSLLSEHFNAFKGLFERNQNSSEKRVKYMASLLDFIHHHLNTLLISGFENSSHRSQSEMGVIERFQQEFELHKPIGIPYDFESFNKIFDKIFFEFDDLIQKKNALEESNSQLLQENLNLKKQNYHLEKLNQELQSKLTGLSSLPQNNFLPEIKLGNEQLGNKQVFDLVSEADKDYFLKITPKKMDTPMKENSDIDFTNLKQLISANPLINQEDGLSIISKFDKLNRLNDNSGDNSNRSLNTFGKHSGPLTDLAKKRKQFKEDDNEAAKLKKIEDMLNHAKEKFRLMEQIIAPENDLEENSESNRDNQLISQSLSPENARQMLTIVHELKQFPSKLMSLISLNRRQDQDLSRVVENFEKTMHDLNGNPSKNTQIIHLLEQVINKLGGTNYPSSDPILPSDVLVQPNDAQANEALFKKRLNETMNITFEHDVVSEDASKLWKFLFDVMRFRDKEKDGLDFMDPKILEKVNTSVRNKLLRLFGADQNFYDLCTLTHCTYYQSVATVLKISLKYLKLTALLIVKLSEYEDNERISCMKKIIGDESKMKVANFDELKSKSVYELDDFYFLSSNEKIDRLKESTKKVQSIESSELNMIDNLVSMLEISK